MLKYVEDSAFKIGRLFQQRIQRFSVSLVITTQGIEVGKIPVGCYTIVQKEIYLARPVIQQQAVIALRITPLTGRKAQTAIKPLLPVLLRLYIDDTGIGDDVCAVAEKVRTVDIPGAAAVVVASCRRQADVAREGAGIVNRDAAVIYGQRLIQGARGEQL